MTNEYKLYGLTSNPFREASAEAIEGIYLLHVNQKIDSELACIVGELSEGGGLSWLMWASWVLEKPRDCDGLKR
jgi:hypothetical protein